MLYQLVNIFGTAIENLSFLLCFETIFGRKYQNRLIYGILIFVQTLLIISANRLVGLQNIISIVCIVLYSVVGIFFYKRKPYLKPLFGAVYYIFLVLLDYFVITVFSLIYEQNAYLLIADTKFYTGMVAISKITLFILVFIFYKTVDGELLQLNFKRKNWLIIFFAQFFSFLIIIFYLWDEIVFQQATYAIFFILCSILGIMMLEFYMLKMISQQNEIEMKNKLLQTELKMKTDYILYVQTQLQKTNQLYHDFNKHLYYISLLIEQNHFDKAETYLKSVIPHYSEPKFTISTGHQIIDIILNYKLAQATAQQIQFELKMKDLQRIQIDAMDLVILLDNALDNAIEACMEMQNVVIRIKLVYENGRLLISIINPCSHPVVIHPQNRIESSKPDAEKHGIGLMNIKQVIRKYDGELMLRFQEGYFYFICEIKDE